MKHFCLRIGLAFSFWGTFWAVAVHGAEQIPVFVGIVPQKYFVEKIGGELVKVETMVKPGASAATYEPKPHQMVALSKAKIYYAIGVPFERVWLKKIASANRNMMVVHTEKGIKKMPMKVYQHDRKGKDEDYERERHDGGGSHHGIMDPHVWLSPPLVKIQARNILDALLRVNPAHSNVYQAKYEKFIVELDALDREIRGIFAGKGEHIEFMVFHPAWGYFAHTYGLEQIAVEIEGKEPKPAELKGLIRYAKERNIKVVFVQPEFSARSAKTIARAIGGEVVFASPLASDWAENLKEVAAKFKAALR